MWQVSPEQALSRMSWGNHSFPDGGSSVIFFPALLESIVLDASHQGGGAGSKVRGTFVTMGNQ